MEISEIEKKRIEKAMIAFMERRKPPVSVRSKLDLGYRISGQSVELFEIRPKWDNPGMILQEPRMCVPKMFGRYTGCEVT